MPFSSNVLNKFVLSSEIERVGNEDSMLKAAVAEMLGTNVLFKTLDLKERDALASELHETHFEAGQSIFSRGDEGRDLFIVKSGRVRLSVLTPEGRELSFTHVEEGKLFGEIAVLDGGQRSADATAVTKTTLYSLSKPSLKRFLNANENFRDSLVSFLCSRIREADQQIEGIALYPIEVRLARFFLASALQKSGKTLPSQATLDFSISQSELALLIGASRPKVNAALALLEEEGAIIRQDKELLCHIEKLQEISSLFNK